MCSIATPLPRRSRAIGRLSSTTAPGSRSPVLRRAGLAGPSRSTSAARRTCWPLSSATRRRARRRHQFGPGLRAKPPTASRRLPHRPGRSLRRQQARPRHAGRARGRPRPRCRRRQTLQPHRPSPVRRLCRQQRREPGRAHRARRDAAGPAGRQPERPARLHRRARCRQRIRRDGRDSARTGRLLQRLLGTRRGDPRPCPRAGRAQPRADSTSSSTPRGSVPSMCPSSSAPPTGCAAPPAGPPHIPLDTHPRRPARVVAHAHVEV